MLKRLALLLIAVAPALISCNADRNPEEPDPFKDYEFSHDMIVLGERLDDPYSVENVEAALESLYPTKGGRIVLKPTDIYVRFLPKDEEEYDRLLAAGLYLVDHPLDYSIVRDGDYYHDPTLGDNQITWQYSVVKAGSVLPEGIRTEVLDECYIADNDAATRSDGIDWDLVEREAYRLTGNLDLLERSTKADASSATPSGRICVVDDRFQDAEPEGLACVRVSCNSFVKFSDTYTDEDGYYCMDKAYASELRYRIVFQNETGFAIGLNKVLVPASTSTLGKNGPEGISLTIDKSSDRKLWCRSVVNNAAYEYLSEAQNRTRKILAPPVNLRLWLFQNLESSSAPMLQQGVIVDGSFIGEFLGEYRDLVKMFLPDITLGMKTLEDYSSIYAVTVHELAHGSHFSQVGKSYWNKYIGYVLESFVKSGGRMYGLGEGTGSGLCEIGEMWAYYIQNRMYSDRYGDGGATFGTSYWFYPHIFLYLDERGLDRSMIFRSLREGVTTREELREELEDLYPDYRTVICQAFDRYSE